MVATESADAALHSPIAPQASSHFLRLPAEIRNMVYAYALGGNTWSVKPTRSLSGAPEIRVDNGIRNALALLQVNRQIHAEAHLHPHLYSTFAGVHNGHLRDWVKALPSAQRRCVTTIKRYMRGYIIHSADHKGLSINPGFWMDVPRLRELGLDGLQRIEVEVSFQKWRWDTDQGEMVKVIEQAMSKLRAFVEEAHSGVVVHVVSRQGY